MPFTPKPHEIYKHFKGNLYQIAAVAEHSETGEQLVVYQALYGDFKTYARPLAMFTDRVDREKYPDVDQEFRFELQGADRERQQRAAAMEQKAAAPGQGNVPPMEKDAVSAQSDAVAITSLADELEEPNIDPLVMEFLDADSYAQKLNILAGLHHRITDDMITTMAIACDIEVEDADTQKRYESLRSSLLTMEKYECNRLN